jgi:hypothetical protein
LLLPYDLTNRADLLIRLGRFEEAATALAEVDEGVSKRLEAYVSRQSRVAFLRALSATLSNQLPQAAALIKVVPKSQPSSPTATLTLVIDRYVRAKQARASSVSPDGAMAATDPATDRERQYWTAAAALAEGNARGALAAALAGTERATKIGNDELTWRIAAIGSAAARKAGDVEQQRALRGLAVAARARLRAAWGANVRRYEQRPDLIELRKASELED